MARQYSKADLLLERLKIVGKEIEEIRRQVLLSLPGKRNRSQTKPSLFGSVQGGDITPAMIESAQSDLFRTSIDL